MLNIFITRLSSILNKKPKDRKHEKTIYNSYFNWVDLRDLS